MFQDAPFDQQVEAIDKFPSFYYTVDDIMAQKGVWEVIRGPGKLFESTSWASPQPVILELSGR